MKNYYRILGVSPQASTDEIRERYRSQVTSCHPDKFLDPTQKENAEEIIKELNQAYEVLSNPGRRAAYDRQARTQKEPRREPVRPKPGHPKTYATITELDYQAPVTPIPSHNHPSVDFIHGDTGYRPHLQQRFFSKRGQYLKVWVDRPANIMLLDHRNYIRYVQGKRFEYLGGYARQSPVQIPVPQDGWWRLVIDLGGESGRITTQAVLLV